MIYFFLKKLLKTMVVWVCSGHKDFICVSLYLCNAQSF